jgi:hypothetical protein
MSLTHDEIAMKLEPEWGELVLSIIEAAHQRFFACGAGTDFCLQSKGPQSIVFGSRNRVKWTADRSFVPDRPYCTPSFLDAWDALDSHSPR